MAGIRILQKSRDGRIRKRGGGVALAFNTSLCNFKQRQLKIFFFKKGQLGSKRMKGPYIHVIKSRL